MTNIPEASIGSVPQSGMNTSGPQPVPDLLRRYRLYLVLSGLLTIVSTALLKWGFKLQTYPYSNPIFQKYSFQFDFVCFRPRFAYFHQADFFAYSDQTYYFNYPAPMALVYEFFYKFVPQAHYVFVALCVLTYVACAVLFARALIRRNIAPRTAVIFSATALLISQPLLLQLYLANMEIVVWAFVVLGTWSWFRERFWIAAACFGLAASLKIFPFVFLSLLLSRKKYKQAAFGVLVGIISSLFSLWVLGPDVHTAYKGLQRGMAWFQEVYLFSFHKPESSVDHSLFALIKVPLYFAHRTDLLRYILRPVLLTEAIAGITLYFLVIRRLPSINQVLALTVAGVLLPPLSHDYTLLHMYIPWVLLVLFSLRHAESPAVRQQLRFVFGCFLVLFSAENYLIFHSLRFAGQIKAIALIALFIIALRTPFETGESEDRPLHLAI